MSARRFSSTSNTADRAAVFAAGVAAALNQTQGCKAAQPFTRTDPEVIGRASVTALLCFALLCFALLCFASFARGQDRPISALALTRR
jgi:hypothetical protein